jgi:methionyl-tRNA formyltransferase
MKKINTIFIGTSEFSIHCLDALLQLDFINLVGVITQPDKPVGRKQVLTPPVLKAWLKKCYPDIDIFQPFKIKKEGISLVKKLNPDLIVVASYGQIIPVEILEYPKFKCVNVHASLLPELRGAVPIQMAILLGLKETGVTLQRMVYELDEGPIICYRKCEINPKETYETLLDKLSKLARELIQECLPEWIAGKIDTKIQDNSRASYCYLSDVSKEKAEIKFDTPPTIADRMIRAFYPYPGAWFNFNGKRVKIFKAKVIEDVPVKRTNILIARKNKDLFLLLKTGVLKLEEIQLEGKKLAHAKNYLWFGEKII